MTTLTIPKELSKEKELVLIPKKVYLKFLELQKKQSGTKVLPKKIHYFNPTAKELKVLEKAKKEYAAGKYMTLKEFNNALASRRSS